MLKPYRMFQPSGPNLRRSCTVACKRVGPQIRVRVRARVRVRVMR